MDVGTRTFWDEDHRCNFKINFARKDLDKFNEILSGKIFTNSLGIRTIWDEDQGDEKEVSAIINEVNYGWYDKIQSLAEAGLTFTISHGSGSAYGPGLYACYEGELVQCDARMDDEVPIVSVYDGGANKEELQNCAKYYEILAKIKQKRRLI